METWDVVIVGAGAAGYFAARAAKERDPTASVLLVSGEDRIPYKRTKISKHIAGGYNRDQFAFQPEEAYLEQGIDLLLGTNVERILPARRELLLHGGEKLRWRRLVLAPGADPVLPELPELPEGTEAPIAIRSAEQVDRLIQAAAEHYTCAVIGMGVLGVEVTEQLVRAGKRVVLIGRSAMLMPRELDAHAAAEMDGLFRGYAVDLRYRKDVSGLERTEAGRYRIRLSPALPDVGETPDSAGGPDAGNETVEADLVVACIGIRPRTDLAADAGLAVGQGIKVDEYLRTSYPDIYAAGDAAEHPGGLVTHLWHAAEMQGRIAGGNAAGGLDRYIHPGFRLKAELFDRYFFSMNKPPDLSGGEYDQDERVEGKRYRRFFYRDGILAAVIMIDDRDRAKLYERAVRERWPREKVESVFLA